MWWSRPAWATLLCSAITQLPLIATGQVPADSLSEYDLDELVVSSSYTRGMFESVRKLGLAELAQLVPVSADAAVSYLPSAHIQTNSRGETLVYLRNSGERQVAVFLDGAPLNIAWDNRVDLSLVPSGAVGSVALIAGPSSVLLGTNVGAGAIELISRLPESGSTVELDASTGSQDFLHGGLRYFGELAGWRLGSTAEYSERSDLRLPSGVTTQYSQDDSGQRTNTDWRLANVHLRGQRQFSNRFALGLTLTANAGAKGVAPESHLNPEEGGIRYWRYPDSRRAMLIANGNYDGDKWRTTFSSWAVHFSQKIAQYESMTYESVSDNRSDRDNSIGARAVTETSIGSGALRFTGTYAANEHEQRDESADSATKRRFRQDVYSAGVEVESSTARPAVIRLGSSIDGYHAPGTGISGSAGIDYSASAGIYHEVAPGNRIRVSAARKVRFPTARESQDTGLGRFILNPTLRPETTYLLEFGLEGESKGFGYAFVPFLQRTTDTIDQVRVTIDSVSYRQRVNFEGSRVFGVEVLAGTNPASRISLAGSVTAMRAIAFNDGETKRLTERPDVLATATTRVRAGRGFSASSELRLTGRSYGLGEDGQLVGLRKSALLNGKLSHAAFISRYSLGVQTFIRVENIFNAPSVPQLGLPGPGRFIRVGLSVTR